MRGRWLLVLLVLASSACTHAPMRPERARRARAVEREAPPVEVARARPPESPIPPAPPPVVRPDDGPLTAKIDANTPAARGNALRLTEEGRQRLAAGDSARAIELFERAVAVDARLPYPYYFLAQAHADLHHRELAQHFLDRAGQKLAHEPYWRSRVDELRGKLYAEAGKTAAAEAAYRRALEAWPDNQVAAEALTAASQRDKETSESPH